MFSSIPIEVRHGTLQVPWTRSSLEGLRRPWLYFFTR
jgi:hypothetical protein